MKKTSRPSKDPIIAAKQLMDKITGVEPNKNTRQVFSKKKNGKKITEKQK